VAKISHPWAILELLFVNYKLIYLCKNKVYMYSIISVEQIKYNINNKYHGYLNFKKKISLCIII
jgi:hypothetical protein